jgi:hypothetical protein
LGDMLLLGGDMSQCSDFLLFLDGIIKGLSDLDLQLIRCWDLVDLIHLRSKKKEE